MCRRSTLGTSIDNHKYVETASARLASIRTSGWILFGMGFGAIAIGLGLAPNRFFPSYLMGFIFWIGITLGCFPLLMIYHLVGGGWGRPLRKFLEAGVSTLPLMGILLVPIIAGSSYLYRWAQPGVLAADPILQRKEVYLNFPAFVLRMILFFIVWGVLALLLLRWSRAAPSAETQNRLRRISGGGLVFFGLATSFAYIDWVMALEPDWYSSIFPVIILVGQILGALAFAIVAVRFAGSDEPVTPDQFNQLGDLLLAFVMLWAYTTFGQIIIIYAGNLPHEIVWYLHRMRGGWLIVSWLLAIFAFIAPFSLLLFRQMKRSPRVLCGLAVGLFVIQGLCVFWYVAPSFRPVLSVEWIDLLSFFGFGGAWIAVASHRLIASPLKE